MSLIITSRVKINATRPFESIPLHVFALLKSPACMRISCVFPSSSSCAHRLWCAFSASRSSASLALFSLKMQNIMTRSGNAETRALGMACWGFSCEELAETPFRISVIMFKYCPEYLNIGLRPMRSWYFCARVSRLFVELDLYSRGVEGSSRERRRRHLQALNV